jgi:hypothetical protein
MKPKLPFKLIRRRFQLLYEIKNIFSDMPQDLSTLITEYCTTLDELPESKATISQFCNKCFKFHIDDKKAHPVEIPRLLKCPSCDTTRKNIYAKQLTDESVITMCCPCWIKYGIYCAHDNTICEHKIARQLKIDIMTASQLAHIQKINKCDECMLMYSRNLKYDPNIKCLDVKQLSIFEATFIK